VLSPESNDKIATDHQKATIRCYFSDFI